MPTVASQDLRNAIPIIRTVETGQTVAVGNVVKDGNADGECQRVSGKTDLAIGVVIAIGGNTAVTAGTAGDKVTIVPLVGGVLTKVLSGGTCTRGQQAGYGGTAGTVADVTPDGAPSSGVWTQTYGFFTHSAVSGDLVGMYAVRGGVLEE
jgi:hypothetical protein